MSRTLAPTLPPKGRAWCRQCGGRTIYDGYKCASCGGHGHVPKDSDAAAFHLVDDLTELQRSVLIQLDHAGGPLGVPGLAGNMQAQHGREFSRSVLVRTLRTLRGRAFVHVHGGGTAWSNSAGSSKQSITSKGRKALTEPKA